MSRIDDARRALAEDLPRLAGAHDVPGVSVAVLVDGQVAAGTAGVLNRRTGVRVTPDSLFMIQSITKVWTATLVMQLVDEGLVTLDAPVRTYLPRFRTADESASAQITVRHLLTHTGGFEGDIWAATTTGDDALQHFVEDLVAAAPQHARPGAMFSYCSAGYGVLGHLVEVLRGSSYASALRRQLAEPLGVSEIAFCADEALTFRTAIGHVSSGSAAARPVTVWSALPASNPAAGNQLAMSARALLAFARMHLADGVTPDGTRLLSSASARAMRVRQVDHPAGVGERSGQGLGWMLAGTPGVVEHGGDAPGVSALLRTVPDQGVAVAMTINGDDPDPVVRELVDPLLSELAGVEPAATLASPGPDVPVTQPQRYVGRYQTRTARHEVTADEDGRLWSTASARNESLTVSTRAGASTEPETHELRQIDGDVFALTDSSGAAVGTAEFLGTDATGRATLLHTGLRAGPRVDHDTIKVT